MQYHILALSALLASASAASFVGRIAKGLFGRDELEAMLIQARDASEAEWYGKIQNWAKPEPVGMSETIKGILKQGGCNPPTGTKAKRSLDAEVSEQHLILVRSTKNQPIKKQDAWAAAQNPAALPAGIKKAFKAAGWTGTCVGGIKARGLDNEIEDFELYAREFDFDDEFAHEY